MDDGDDRGRPSPPPGGFGALPPRDDSSAPRRGRPGVGMPGYRRAREAGAGGPALNWPRLAVVGIVALVVLLLVIVPLVSGGSGASPAPSTGSPAALGSSSSTSATAVTCQPSDAAPPVAPVLPASWQPLGVPHQGFGIAGATSLYADAATANGASATAWVATGACDSASAAALQPLAQTLFVMADNSQPVTAAGPSSGGLPSGVPPVTSSAPQPPVSPPDTSNCDFCGTYPTDSTPFHAAAWIAPAAVGSTPGEPCRPGADGRSVTCTRADDTGATTVVVWIGSDPAVALFVAAKASPASYIPTVYGLQRTLVGAMNGPVGEADAVATTPTPAAAG